METLREIGVAVKAYIRNAGLTAKWLGHDVGLFLPGGQMEWESFAKNENDVTLMLNLGKWAATSEASLVTVASRLFREFGASQYNIPYLTPLPVRKWASDFPTNFEIMNTVACLQKLGGNLLEIEKSWSAYLNVILKRTDPFLPFLIPIVQSRGEQTRLSGAVVIYLEPTIEVVEILPIIKAIAVPLLAGSRQRLGLLPRNVADPERYLMDLVMEFPGSNPLFGDGNVDSAITQHVWDWRLSGLLKGTCGEMCSECSDAESSIFSCPKCKRGTASSLCAACDDFWKKLRLCTSKCTEAVKQLFYSGDLKSSWTKSIPATTLARILDCNLEGKGVPIKLPQRPGILPILQLKRIRGSLGPGAKPTLTADGKGGASVSFPLTAGKVGELSLREVWESLRNRDGRCVPGETTQTLWWAQYGHFPRYLAAYLPDEGRTEMYIRRILGPHEIPIFSIDVLDSAVIVSWSPK